MIRRHHPVIIGLLLAAAIGCRKTETPPPPSTETTPAALQEKAPQTVTIWWAQWAPADGLQELGKDYEKATGVAVKVHQIPWSNYQDQVFLNFGNKTTSFDIVVGDSQWLGRGAQSKLYLDLTDWLPTVVDVKSIHPQALRYLCEYPGGSGHYFAAPCETDAVGFAYRKDWFADPKEQAAFKAKYKRALDVPNTWAEFKDIAERLERHSGVVQDLEFTIERGKLYMLQTRAAKRTGAAAVRIAIDLVAEGVQTREGALRLVLPEHVDQLLRAGFAALRAA